MYQPIFDFISSIFGYLVVLIPAILGFLNQRKNFKLKLISLENEKKEIEKVHLEEKKEHLKKAAELSNSWEQIDLKTSFYMQIMQLRNTDVIKTTVSRVFKETSATRFIALIGVNGKSEMNFVSAIMFEYKHEQNKISPIKRYSNLKIDDPYKLILKRTEADGSESLTVSEMPKSLLKDIYINEEVNQSEVVFGFRKPIDKFNDFLLYFSWAKEEDVKFTSIEKMIFRSETQGEITQAIDNLIQ